MSEQAANTPYCIETSTLNAGGIFNTDPGTLQLARHWGCLEGLSMGVNYLDPFYAVRAQRSCGIFKTKILCTPGERCCSILA